MHSILNGLIDIFKTQPAPVLTPTEFKKLTYNDLQQVLYKCLKSIGLKPHITKNCLPPNKGQEVSIDKVYLINGCKVTIALINPNNSLLVISIFGKDNIITEYTKKINCSSELLLNTHGIVIEAFQKNTDKNISQLVISQYISPVTDIKATIINTLKYIK
jgi:hypothetical protein